MKRVLNLVPIFLMLIVCCSKEKHFAVEGAWQLIYADYPSYNLSYPNQMTGGGIKMWSQEHFCFVGNFQQDTLSSVNYGTGTYKLDNKKYEENISYHFVKSLIGTTMRMLIEFKGDTLIQRFPADDKWNLEEKFNTEKYIRLR